MRRNKARVKKAMELALERLDYGVVSDRYKVVQNADAFCFTDELLGKGVRYETGGSLQEGNVRKLHGLFRGRV